MRRLGISIYPEKSTKEEVIRYIDKASKIGAKRIFSCLLSVTKNKEEIKKEFTEINEYAHEKGMEVILDVAPNIFNELGISYKDLSFFKDIKADGIRLDLGFSGSEEALMTYNPYDLKIEINMSNNVHTIDTIMDYKPNRYNLYGCHNFYPHIHTGLSIEFLEKCTSNFKKYGLKTAAFVSSSNRDSFGPWLAKEGLPTLEIHRDLPIDTQIKHYIALDNIDDIIISNCYPTDEEMEKISKIRLDLVEFDVELIDNLDEVEEKIILEELHFNRGDINQSLIRSTQPRVKYRGHHFKVHNAKDIKKGDILIESSEYGHYAGELQIALKDMKNTGKTNIVGKIVESEHILLDFIKPWQKFRFKKK